MISYLYHGRSHLLALFTLKRLVFTILLLNEIIYILRVPDGVDIMKKMEVDKHKVSIMKCLPGIRENVVINSKADWDVAKIVANKLKGKIE